MRTTPGDRSNAADAVLPAGLVQAAGQPGEGRLAGAVRREVAALAECPAPLARLTTRPPPPAIMCGDDGRLMRNGPAHVDRDRPPPLLDVGLPQRGLGLDHPGAVDQDVDPAERLEHGADAVVDVGRVGDLGALHEDPAAGRGDVALEGGQGAGVAGHGGHRVTGGSQGGRHAAPDPPAGAGDDGDAAHLRPRAGRRPWSAAALAMARSRRALTSSVVSVRSGARKTIR